MKKSYPHITRLRGKLHRGHKAYLRWQAQKMPVGVLFVLIAIVLGLLTGMAAAALKRMIALIDDLVLPGLHCGGLNIRLLIFPLAGILATGIFQRYVVRGKVARGTRIIKEDLETHKFKLSPFTIFNPIIGCAMTIGCGASGGSEGPTALSGAAIGSSVGRWFGLSDAWLRLLVGIGGGAGIAAIFKSPTGGVLFTLEVLQMQMTTLPVIALILACLIASATAYLLSDFTFDIFFEIARPMDPAMLGWVILLGIFCGLYCIYYNYTKKHATRLFTSIKNPWFAISATGGLMSVCVFMFPTLYGEGFPVITKLVNGWPISFTEAGVMAGLNGFEWMVLAVGMVLALKGILVAAAYSGGGVAGDFVPTFFAGAVAGFLFGTLCQKWFGADIPVWYCSVIGMGCVMAGTIHAPLMALFILCETTNTYSYFFPYLLAIGASYATVKILTPKSWYGETGHDDLMALMNLRQTPSLKTSSRKNVNLGTRTSNKTQQDQ